MTSRVNRFNDMLATRGTYPELSRSSSGSGFFRCIGLLILGTLLHVPAIGQVPGGDPGGGPDEADRPADTLFIFAPARPLIDSSGIRTDLPSALGGSVLFSSSGYGIGLFYERKLTPTLSGFFDVVISGLRRGDELEVYNNNPESVHYQSFFVPGKVNRLWQAPAMLGVKKELFENLFFDNFRPFVSAGLGVSTVIATPYDQTFFRAFGSASWRFAPGGFVGLGAEVTGMDPGVGFAIRYYLLPLSPGVESMEGEPITDLGGLFLTLTIPF